MDAVTLLVLVGFCCSIIQGSYWVNWPLTDGINSPVTVVIGPGAPSNLVPTFGPIKTSQNVAGCNTITAAPGYLCAASSQSSADLAWSFGQYVQFSFSAAGHNLTIKNVVMDCTRNSNVRGFGLRMSSTGYAADPTAEEHNNCGIGFNFINAVPGPIAPFYWPPDSNPIVRMVVYASAGSTVRFRNVNFTFYGPCTQATTAIANGYIIGGTVDHLYSPQIICNDGYIPVNNILCGDTTFSGSGSCVAYNCTSDPPITHGSYSTCVGTLAGQTCSGQLTCDPGYAQVGADPTCTVSSTWANAPTCQLITCTQSELPYIRNGTWSCSNPSSVPGNTACTLTCDSGTNRVGGPEPLCVAQDTFASTTARCDGPGACVSGTENSNLQLNCNNVIPGSAISSIDFASYGKPTCDSTCGSQNLCGVVNPTCDAPSSQSFVQTNCLGLTSCTIGANNGNFPDPCSGQTKNMIIRYGCTPSTCVSNPSDPAGGSYPNCVGQPVGSTCVLNCNPGFYKVGTDPFCVQASTWSSAPSCVAVSSSAGFSSSAPAAVPSSSAPAIPSSSAPVIPSSSAPVIPSSSAPVIPSSSAPVIPSSSAPPVIPSSSSPPAAIPSSSSTPPKTSSSSVAKSSSSVPKTSSSSSVSVAPGKSSSSAPAFSSSAPAFSSSAPKFSSSAVPKFSSSASTGGGGVITPGSSSAPQNIVPSSSADNGGGGASGEANGGGGGGGSSAAVAGGIVGALVVFGVIGAVFFFRRRRKAAAQTADKAMKKIATDNVDEEREGEGASGGGAGGAGAGGPGGPKAHTALTVATGEVALTPIGETSPSSRNNTVSARDKATPSVATPRDKATPSVATPRDKAAPSVATPRDKAASSASTPTRKTTVSAAATPTPRGKNATQVGVPLAPYLASAAGLAAFKAYLAKEMSAENLAFWQAVENYRGKKVELCKKYQPYDLEVRKALKVVATEIFRNFLSKTNLQNSNVNLPEDVDARTIQRLQLHFDKGQDQEDGDPQKTIFDEAQEVIYKLMESDTWLRFQRSPDFVPLKK